MMKAKIEKDFLILIPEDKGECKKLIKLLDNNCVSAVIPQSRKKLAYYLLENIKVIIIL